MRLARWINAFTALALLAFVAPALASGGDVKASAPSGFTVIALVTTDQDWLRKWNTPTPGVALNGTDTLRPGQKATLVVSFSNARSSGGRTELYCDVSVRHSVDQKQNQSMGPTLCYDGPAVPPNLIALTNLQINIQGNSGSDPAETVRFDIRVTDKNGGGRVPVSLVIRFVSAGSRI